MGEWIFSRFRSPQGLGECIFRPALYISGWQAGQGGPHQWDNMPEQPMLDNPNAGPGGPPPMPTGFAPQIQGYNNVGAFGQPSE